MKFTFKTDKPTGRFRSFNNEYHHVKLKGKNVGSIDDVTFKVNLKVVKTAEDLEKPNDNKNCPWKWITFKAEFKTLQEAKDWLNANVDALTKKYTLFADD